MLYMAEPHTHAHVGTTSCFAHHFYKLQLDGSYIYNH